MVAAREDICRLMTAESGAAGCCRPPLPAAACCPRLLRPVVLAGCLLPALGLQLNRAGQRSMLCARPRHLSTDSDCAGKPLAEARAEFDSG